MVADILTKPLQGELFQKMRWKFAADEPSLNSSTSSILGSRSVNIHFQDILDFSGVQVVVPPNFEFHFLASFYFSYHDFSHAWDFIPTDREYVLRGCVRQYAILDIHWSECRSLDFILLLLRISSSCYALDDRIRRSICPADVWSPVRSRWWQPYPGYAVMISAPN